MSEKNWKILFEDILESINRIEEYTKNTDFDSFFKNRMMTDAVVRNIEIVGEASKRVPEEIKTRLTDIPWPQLSGIRNRIVHDYMGIDLKIIWYIVKNELKPLKKSLKKHL